MKVGDKLVCIKNLVRKIHRIDESNTIMLRSMLKNITDKFENNEIDYDEFKESVDKYESIKDKFLVDFNFFTCGKVYEVNYSFGTSIELISDYNSMCILFRNEDYIQKSKVRYIKDYFITMKESRKIKLDQLSDENFNNFLKGLKE